MYSFQDIESSEYSFRNECGIAWTIVFDAQGIVVDDWEGFVVEDLEIKNIRGYVDGTNRWFNFTMEKVRKYFGYDRAYLFSVSAQEKLINKAEADLKTCYFDRQCSDE